MKYTTMTTLVVLLLGSLGVHAQSAYSKSSGFVTHTMVAGQYNLIGLTLHEPVAVSGAITGVTGAMLTDSAIDFTSSLRAKKTYILEITDASDASLNGTIQEIIEWSSDTMMTPQNLDGEGLQVGDKYQLRAARTISGIFGANNESGLQASTNKNIEEADVLYVPNGNGFDQYFYSSAAGDSGWYKSDLTPAGDVSISYMDAILLFRRGTTDLSLQIYGCVKSTAVTLALKGKDFNYVSTVFPIGVTLGNSGLSASLAATPNYSINEADVVYMPDGKGGYDRYFYSNAASDERWYSDKLIDANNVPMKSGIIIQRRAAATNTTIVPPASYANL